MKASEGRIGRVFVIRLEHGDVVPECIERFAKEKGILVGQAILVGGTGGGDVIVGPRHSDERPPQPMLLAVDGAHETLGLGVIAPTSDGRPVLHMHAALGRAGKTISGCLQCGVTTWLVGEIVLYEILGVDAARVKDEPSGFILLNVGTNQIRRPDC